jgi:ABC-2 type transport system ATP-binding protein
MGDFGVEFLVSDRVACKNKYSGLLMENTNLEEIMLFYVNKEKKEWS